jgi:hypothetical protein
VCGTALACLLGLAPVLEAASEDTRERAAPVVDARVERILADCLTLSESQTTPIPPNAECARKLAALGRSATSAIFARLVGQLARPGASSIDAAGTEDARIAALLVSALAQLPRDSVRAILTSAAENKTDALVRRAAVTVWGECATTLDLEAVCAVAAADLDVDGEPTAMSADLERALAGIAARDPAAWLALRKLATKSPVSHVRSFLRAAALDQGTAALAFLAWGVEALPERRVEAVSELQRASFAVALPVDASVTGAVRRVLELHPADVAAELALISGRFEDAEAVGPLIELLSAQSAGVRASALWALQRISALGFRAEPERWRLWHEEELAWWNTKGDTQIQRLAASDAGTVNMAILELAKRRLHRDRAALAIAGALDHENAAVVELACNALVQLRSRACVPALVTTLEHRSAEARQSAWTALRKLTGKDLGFDARAWNGFSTRP